MLKKLIVFISGSSGSGKNTVINKLLDSNSNYGYVKSYTTRDKRESDTDDCYNFITKTEFERKIKEGELLEFDLYSNNYYGISKDTISNELKQKDVVFKDITLAGVKNSKEHITDTKIVSIFFTVEKRELVERLKKCDEEHLKERMKFYVKEQKRRFGADYVISNVDLAQTTSTIKTLMDYEQNNKNFLPTKSCQEVLDKKVNKYANKLNKGKSVKPIYVTIKGGKVYIVDGVHRYLASLKSGKHLCKVVLNEEDVNISQDLDVKEWNKIVKMYR